MIEEVEFQSLISLARRALDLYGRREGQDPETVSHTSQGVTVCERRSVIEIFSHGSLVFRHDPKGETTDFFGERGGWMEEVERMARAAPPSSTGVAGQRE